MPLCAFALGLTGLDRSSPTASASRRHDRSSSFATAPPSAPSSLTEPLPPPLAISCISAGLQPSVDLQLRRFGAVAETNHRDATTGSPAMPTPPPPSPFSVRTVLYMKYVKRHDYSELSLAYRPSHADATYDFKYGVRSVQVTDWRKYRFPNVSFPQKRINNWRLICAIAIEPLQKQAEESKMEAPKEIFLKNLKEKGRDIHDPIQTLGMF
nr:puromycin-sensitive aminopeptidase isoform X1 [Ipomoea batatas]